MNLPKRASSNILRRMAITATVLFAVIIAACFYFRISSARDLMTYVGMSRECHPVWRTLAWGGYDVGDSAEEFLQRYPPSRRTEFGRHGVYTYTQDETADGIALTCITVTSRDGKLLSAQASSCAWRFTFFETPNPEFEAGFWEYLQHK